MGSRACLKSMMEHGPVGERLRRSLQEDFPVAVRAIRELEGVQPIHLTWPEFFFAFIPGTRSYRKVRSTKGPIEVG